MKNKRLNHNQVHPKRKRVKKITFDCPQKCEGCGKTCEMDKMFWDGGDNHLCGGCIHAINEDVKTWVCSGCGKTNNNDVKWLYDNWCQNCEDNTFN